jgi:hypothetical protein
MHSFGEVILIQMQFTDTYEIKLRPAVVLYHDAENIVVAGITTNPQAKGITLSTKEGAIRASTITPNYVFTISPNMVKRTLFSLSKTKKLQLSTDITKRLK